MLKDIPNFDVIWLSQTWTKERFLTAIEDAVVTKKDTDIKNKSILYSFKNIILESHTLHCTLCSFFTNKEKGSSALDFSPQEKSNITINDIYSRIENYYNVKRLTPIESIIKRL